MERSKLCRNEGHKFHKYVRQIELEEIDQNGIIFFMYALCGAMGDGGAIDFYSIQNGEICYFYDNINRGFNPESLSPYLPKDITISRDGIVLLGNWKLFGGGMGNEFYIREQYYDSFKEYLKNNKKMNYYRAWQEIAEEFMLDIINKNTKKEII